MGARARRGRLDRPVVARGVRRPGRDAAPAGDLLRGVRAGRRARAGSGIVGEGLLGPTIMHFGTDEQKQRFLPEDRERRGALVPGLLASRTRAPTSRTSRPGPSWSRATGSGSITGQKVWTSLAHWAQWCFVLARTDRERPAHRGISYLLVPMDQPGIEIRPIVQITGTPSSTRCSSTARARPRITSSARSTAAGGSRWARSPSSAARRRSASSSASRTSGTRSCGARGELGRASDPVLRQRLADAWIGLEIMRYTALRGLTAMAKGEVTRETSITKLYWATLHRELGELAIDVLGPYGRDRRRRRRTT